jgi:hypothetical protein
MIHVLPSAPPAPAVRARAAAARVMSLSALTVLLGLFLAGGAAPTARAGGAADGGWWEPEAPVAGSMLTIHYDLVARGALPPATTAVDFVFNDGLARWDNNSGSVPVGSTVRRIVAVPWCRTAGRDGHGRGPRGSGGDFRPAPRDGAGL